MTDLLSRPRVSPSSASPPEGRQLPLSAAIASVGAVLTGLVICGGLCIVGWFLADGGSHGSTTDALRVGARVWLVGHGSGLDAHGVPMNVVPLTLTVLLLSVCLRLGRWASAASAPVTDDRTVGLAAATFTGLYVVIATVLCLCVGSDAAEPGLGRTVLGALLLSGVGGTLGLASGSGRLALWWARVPGWIRAMTYGAAATTLLLVVAGSVLVAVRLGMGLNDASVLIGKLGLSGSDLVAYVAVCAAVAPNAVLLGVSYLLGPGFAVGTGTLVSPAVVTLGPVPAFPLLAALPAPGPTPQWLLGVMAVPVVAAVVGAVLAQRRYRVTAYDSSALRGFGSGLGAALLTTALVALAGGPMGTGRMSLIGAPLGQVLVSGLLAMCLSGMVAGVVTAFVQRRRDRAEG